MVETGAKSGSAKASEQLTKAAQWQQIWVENSPLQLCTNTAPHSFESRSRALIIRPKNYANYGTSRDVHGHPDPFLSTYSFS